VNFGKKGHLEALMAGHKRNDLKGQSQSTGQEIGTPALYDYTEIC